MDAKEALTAEETAKAVPSEEEIRVEDDIILSPSHKHNASPRSTRKGSLDFNIPIMSEIYSKELIRYDESASEHQHLIAEAKKIFSKWDITKDSIITTEEIHQSGLDPIFASSLARVLSDDDPNGHIHVEDLINCLTTLHYGHLHDKVVLVLKFLGTGGNNTGITYEEASLYLNSAPKKVFQRLGFIAADGVSKQSLSFQGLLNIFESSDRGQEAMDLFCKRILSVLTNFHNDRLQAERAPRRYSIAIPMHQPSCSTFSQVIFERIKHIERITFFMAGVVILQIALYLYNFFYYYNKGLPISFCIAKGFGINLRIMTILLFLTMARTTMGYFYEFPLIGNLVPMGCNIQLHSFIGFSTVIHAFGHMIGHIVFSQGYLSGKHGSQFDTKSIYNGGTWTNRQIGGAISGYLLLGVLLIMAAAALYRGKDSKAYAAFYHTHYLYLVWIVFILLHVPNLWIYFTAIGSLMVLERGCDLFFRTTYSTLATSRQCSNGVTFLSVPRYYPSTPGSYYRIKVPEISSTEWHPFSLAGSVSSHHLTFFIASNGDWTRKLYEIVSDPSRRVKCTVLVRFLVYLSF
jgi:Ca2+-binding EF-hand superfamily protein